MKKRISILMLTMCASCVVLAQNNDATPYPYWTLKGIQQIQFKNTEYTPATANVGYTDLVLSKSVHHNKITTVEDSRKVVSTTGTPAWVISKGVHRKK